MKIHTEKYHVARPSFTSIIYRPQLDIFFKMHDEDLAEDYEFEESAEVPLCDEIGTQI